MGNINVLPMEVANLIAAGEVVDRPASCVKELMENAIDAGADSLTVEIQRGGVAFIRISDNGAGMEKDELPVAIKRHATSKIHVADDLNSISTLGFRGEALAAISSVSKMRIFSKTAESDTGAVMTVHGGEVIDITETGCQKGTTIVVENLFYNVPARRKFLKKDASEASAVTAVVERIAVSKPGISIRYISDGDTKFVTHGDGDLENTIVSVFGKAFASRLIKVEGGSDGITVSGYISESDVVKPNRNYEMFYINGRYVKSKTAYAAIEQAYRTRIQPDKFPACVLNISMSTNQVDVNVHPAKTEIKFANEKVIFECIYYAVMNALRSGVSRPELDLGRGAAQDVRPAAPAQGSGGDFFMSGESARKYVSSFVPMDRKPDTGTQIRIDGDRAQKRPAVREPEQTGPVRDTSVNIPDSSHPWHYQAPSVQHDAVQTPAVTELPQEEEKQPGEIPEFSVIGEAYNTYVMIQTADRIIIYDKHAAHERVIFDDLQNIMMKKEKSNQLLLTPMEIEFGDTESDVLEEFREEITSAGFSYTVGTSGSGSVTAYISEIPEVLDNDEARELFYDLVSNLSEYGTGADIARNDFFSHKLFYASCKAAIKGGRIYAAEHIRWLSEKVLAMPDNGTKPLRTCPHGRPIAFEIKKSTLDRQFGRT